jgi:glycosyltransferase involved in cell wall biosynthesis
MPRARWRDGLALLKSFTSGTPFLITRDWTPQMAQQLRAMMHHSKFDFIHADQLWMAPYAIHSLRSILHGRPAQLVLDQHNAVQLIPRRMAQAARNPLARWLLQREAHLMKRYEAQTCARFDHLVWVTGEDREAVNRQSSIFNPQSTIPICIDPGEIQPADPLPSQPALLLLGGMHWPPNAEGLRWFLSEIWPQVKRRVPAAQLRVIGKDPPGAALAAEDVHAPGYVADTMPYWRGSRVFIVPLRAGGGMRVKILDAWAHGLPVLATSIGAEGIDYTDGQDILIADEPAAFAEAICRLLTDDALAERIAQGGRATVLAKYNWKTIYQQWDEIYFPR